MDLFLEPVGQCFILLSPLIQAEIMLFSRPLLLGEEEEVEGQSSLQEVVDYVLQAEQTSFMSLGTVIIQHPIMVILIFSEEVSWVEAEVAHSYLEEEEVQFF